MDTKTIIEITGKVKVLPAGHKVDGNATWFRDAEGNFHAEFYKGAVGRVEEDGKYHSYSFNIAADEAEAFANMPIGTTFKCELLPKTRTEVDKEGKNIVVARVTESQDGSSVYHDVTLEGIEVAKEGTIKRPRTTQYFADIKFEEPKADPNADV